MAQAPKIASMLNLKALASNKVEDIPSSLNSNLLFTVSGTPAISNSNEPKIELPMENTVEIQVVEDQDVDAAVAKMMEELKKGKGNSKSTSWADDVKEEDNELLREKREAESKKKNQKS